MLGRLISCLWLRRQIKRVCVSSEKITSDNGAAAALQTQGTYQRQLLVDQQMKTIVSLGEKFQSAESDFIALVAGLDEQKEQSQSLLGPLQIQQSTSVTLNRELHSHDVAIKIVVVLVSYEQLMVPNDAPLISIEKRLRKLKLLCHPNQGGTQEAIA